LIAAVILFYITYADGFSIWLRHNTRFILITVITIRIHQLNGACQIDFWIFILTALSQAVGDGFCPRS